MSHDLPPPELARPEEASALFAMAMDTAGEHPGDVIGPYTLVEAIGDGGFGRVWLAAQAEPVRRQVALKILKPGMDTDEVMSRFREEWRLLALMDHPGIAHVFDAGITPTGRPYFTMELVHGLPITAYCDEHDLSLDDRLRLLIKVCHAVQHAHQKGLIHRDLKPSNILVVEEDGAASPRIIDFGVARALDPSAGERSFVTRLHQIIGTPGYMSPEQAERGGDDLDTRTDIYSLGVVLYEMLTGALPFESEELARFALEAVLRQVREATPLRPSRRITTLDSDRATSVARHRGLPPDRLRAVLLGDLDWIALKCLEKERQRRYDSVGALADDLRLHLENRPVAARPPDRAYLLGCAIRRNRLAFSLGSVTLAALLSGICFSTVFFLRERSARIQSETLRHQAETARGSAEDIITWALGDLRKKLSPLGKLGLLSDIAATADTYYQNLPPSERNTASETRRARVFLLRGDVHYQRNELPKAIDLYREGIAILERVAATNPADDDARKWHGVLVSRLGDALLGHGKFAEALAMRQRHLEIVRAVVAATPDDAQAQHELCISLSKLAESLDREKQVAASRATLEEAIALSREKSPGHLPFALQIRGNWEMRAHNYQAAADAFREAVACFSKAAEDAPDNVKELRYGVQCRISLADCLKYLERDDEARKELTAARELCERFARIDPTNSDVLGDLGSLRMVSGALHFRQGNESAALEDFRETLHIFGGLSRKDPSLIFWHQSFSRLIVDTKPMISKPGASFAVRLLVADIHMTNAECRAAGGDPKAARSELTLVRQLSDGLVKEAPVDPVLAEIIRRADALHPAP
mgnify:CR=1 FL=1